MELVSSFTKSEHIFRILFMKHELTKTIGGAVRYLRNYRGLTAMELAEKVGISDRHVYEIERGTVFPRAKTFDAIAAALEVPVHLLFFPFQDETRRKTRIIEMFMDQSYGSLSDVLAVLPSEEVISLKLYLESTGLLKNQF